MTLRELLGEVVGRLSAPQLVLVVVVFISGCTLARLLNPWNPLNKLPGPLWAKITDLPLIYHAYKGDEAQYVHQLHQRYGPTVRIGLASVDFTQVSALRGIYLNKGGFAKASYYHNFDVDGHASIFSQPDMNARGARAKLILPLFSMASVTSSAGIFQSSMDRFLQELALAKARGSVNILDLARAMSIDGITEYLFDLRYGAFDDVQPLKTSDFKMSASAVVDNFVSASRFWYLPVSLFGWAEWIDLFIHPNPSINTSTQALDEYADRVMCRALQQASDSAEKSDFASFPVRLLRAGFSLCEVRAQCKDIIFAATDTIGMGLTTICFMLAKHPQVYEKLRWEIANAGITRDEEVQQITYLTCVIREGLRLSMTNPCRIPREVPAPGWTHEGITYPAGSVVSCSAFEMHFSDNIYASAHSFQPDRWLNPTVDMNQCMMAFGLGNRSCIAKGISLWELHHIVYQIVKADLLRGARPERDRIEILEGFTAKVTQSRVGIVWD